MNPWKLIQIKAQDLFQLQRKNILLCADNKAEIIIFGGFDGQR